MSDAYRLPRSIEPQRYELTLTPDLDAATFAGEERVRVLAHEAVNEIVLNAAELKILTAEVVDDEGNKLTGTVTLDETNERATIAFDGTVTPGHWTLDLTFTGILNDKLRGFYRSTFTDEDGSQRVIGTTQFEAPHARRAFPCWDEPDFKAVFAVRLIVDEHLTAISNGAAVETTSLGNGKKQVDFADTMSMSTYLVAFIVGPLELTEARVVDGVPLRVAHVPGKGHLTDFALEIGEHALKFFTQYFALPYPGDKLDLIALPDFAFGAMENLGAVTFRETALLVDKEHGSRGDLERVADVVAHEIAHMWFGDLVTMKWWNGIWLNEAFATFMELACVDAFRPEWDRWVAFGIERNGAFAIDALHSTRPVEFPVGPPEEAETMFDVLTYQKGSAVLRMLERYLGAEPFRQGIVNYLAKHSYGNTETTDLWDDIEEATGEPVRALMDSWIFQGGYPVVRAALDDGGSTLALSQQRFTFRPAATPDDSRWIVPVMLRTGEGNHQKLLLEQDSAEVAVGATGPIVANDGGWGFFRAQYSSDLLDRLTTDAVDLAPLERFTIVSDGWALARAGIGTVRDFVRLVRHFGDDDDANVWSVMVGPLGLLDRFAPDATRQQLQTFVRDLAGPALTKVGWERGKDEPERVRPLRATLVEALGLVGADADVQRRAGELHAKLLENRDAVDPDLATPISRIVARNGGEAEYTEFLELVRHPATPQEEVRYLYALAEFQNEGLVRRTLDLALHEVRTQNAPFLVAGLFANRVGGELTWEFVKDHWQELTARFPDNLVPRMVQGTTNLLSPAIADDVKAFVQAQPRLRDNKVVQQAMEQLEINVAFAQREADLAPDVFD
ncbi:MAG: M1 family metallopeptidase [Actinobacteria bacterium]|nr:M1 family metallopeptidase [Actinomycetota bacterium]